MITPGQGRSLVWLASYPRSGNTWTRMLLHNLVNVLAGKDEGPANINDMDRYSTWENYRIHFDKALGRKTAEGDWKTTALSRPMVQARLAAKTHGTLFVKTHLGIVNVLGVPTINASVTAGAIYIVRNPLDVAVSFAPHIGVTIDEVIDVMGEHGFFMGDNIARVYEVIGSWSENVSGWTAAPNASVLVLRYEDMHARPLEQFGRVAKHLGLLPTKEHLQKAIDYSSFQTLRRQEVETGFVHGPSQAVDRFFRSGKTKSWRDKLNRQQVDKIVKAHGDVMARFRYLDDV